MKIRIKLKNKNKHFNLVNLTIILIILCVIMFFIFLKNSASVKLFNYAELETQRLATIIINRSVEEHIIDAQINKIVTTSLNKNNEIVSVDFNTTNINKTLNLITNRVGYNLKQLEEGNLHLDIDPKYLSKDYENKGIIYEIPIGVITKNPFLTNIGPRMPVKLKVVGSVVSNIETKITDYGINNAMLEILLRVEVNEQVILPFISKILFSITFNSCSIVLPANPASINIPVLDEPI